MTLQSIPFASIPEHASDGQLSRVVIKAAIKHILFRYFNELEGRKEPFSDEEADKYIERRTIPTENVLKTFTVFVSASHQVVGFADAKLDLTSGEVGMSLRGDPEDQAQYKLLCRIALREQVDWVESNAQKAAAEATVKLTIWCADKDTIWRKELQDSDLSLIYEPCHMSRSLKMNTTEPTAVECEASLLKLGFEVRPYTEDQAPLVHVSCVAGFAGQRDAEHIGQYEQWVQMATSAENGYDPSLWYILWNKDRNMIAGAVVLWDYSKKKNGTAFIPLVWLEAEFRAKGVAGF
ncbi:hypothetical protein BC830DRAFT_1125605, partial [Chytriomyces sp. MP71]